ncbi:hypothetical protein SO802_024295 [Lithocarpus litseifolius]|uniref:Uncharacterized protein n=1 Tax=Lithocarpus litseifolius TaxID=425828 RepID=A0AAW2CB97_9ROSI
MGKQFLIGTTLGILSLLPFFPLALHTTYDLVIFCHPTEVEDGGDNESQTGVIPNMEIDFGGEDNTAYVTNVTHGEDTTNLSNTQALKHNNDTKSLAQLEGINSELLVPNLESMKHGIKEPEVIRSGSDKGSLEGFNAESNTGFPGIKESSVKPATSQCRVISTTEIEEQPTNVRTWTIWHCRNSLRISDNPFPILRVLQDARSVRASYIVFLCPFLLNLRPRFGQYGHTGIKSELTILVAVQISSQTRPKELLTKFQAVQQPSLPQSTPIRVRWRAPILDMGTGATQTDQGSGELPLKEGPIKAQSMAQY